MRRIEMRDKLTEREADVVRLGAQGKTNRQIGVALGISEQTVKNHWTHIIKKLGVEDRASSCMMFFFGQLNPNLLALAVARLVGETAWFFEKWGTETE